MIKWSNNSVYRQKGGAALENAKYIFFAVSLAGVILNFSAKKLAGAPKNIMTVKLIALAIVFLSVCAMFIFS